MSVAFINTNMCYAQCDGHESATCRGTCRGTCGVLLPLQITRTDKEKGKSANRVEHKSVHVMRRSSQSPILISSMLSYVIS